MRSLSSAFRWSWDTVNNLSRDDFFLTKLSLAVQNVKKKFKFLTVMFYCRMNVQQILSNVKIQCGMSYNFNMVGNGNVGGKNWGIGNQRCSEKSLCFE